MTHQKQFIKDTPKPCNCNLCIASQENKNNENILQEKQETLQTAINNINALRNHTVTQDFDAQQKQVWDICLGYAVGAVTEELEDLKKPGDVICI
jgi:hypothetical protein